LEIQKIEILFYNSFAASCDNFDSLPIFKILHKIFRFNFFFERFFLLPSNDNLRCVICQGYDLPLETFNLPTVDHDRIANEKVCLGIWFLEEFLVLLDDFICFNMRKELFQFFESARLVVQDKILAVECLVDIPTMFTLFLCQIIPRKKIKMKVNAELKCYLTWFEHLRD